jgi:hypothetical protein
VLDEVLAAHGGAADFAKVRGLRAEMSFGRPFWAARGWPGILDQTTVEIDTARERRPRIV